MISPAQEKNKYAFHNNNFESQGYVQMFHDFIAKAIRPHKLEIKTALDFGSGPGPVLAELLRQEGFETDIYDKHFAPEKIYLNKKYDLITATEVFEHLADPMETLKLLKTLLNNHGIIAIMTLFHPNNDEEFKKWWYRRDSTHICFYTSKTLQTMADLIELKVSLVNNKNICVIGNK
ncbi:hypothetical protein A2291_07725 [candidate division WOR-1 bacterium RIFOXYB2_FULL_42_35]|uniref:Methyltransferase n=1 Tax=candidate division WOR-1 bacterium RIFOXYC2_FULL_41_25 TaxID=1802586 RepID=A0A1F4TJ26_UNCSA|nr:MAG: hypothetical protein A2247_08250 [candidate division WOR-1 bacterium RIFOXYA2_FULL_41_14]OGC21824.1 MAG: hypothetical protein A2291_07725 [candidate division WOR-1 bacterium RIFOXYB2_FULL_42_35]OGC32722.1 MAG: hypothetical protein A2462_04115 [candidate division WOR-1 bacterium RIFOXYC2_FULL_41_25]OGC44044.1 MAG: hypothetical protein A2548_00355 [candidate division WOR-1 bacterium RIFOXYD2_FULL_41_8]